MKRTLNNNNAIRMTNIINGNATYTILFICLRTTQYIYWISPRLLLSFQAWLCDIEKNMRLTLKEELKKCRANLKRMLSKRDKWMKEHPGQMCITTSQIQWTADVTKALVTTKERGDQKPIKTLKKKQVAMLNKFSEAIRGNLTKQQRLKVVALVTIEVHARDILEKMVKTKIADSNAFEWLSQLRLYWDRVRT